MCQRTLHRLRHFVFAKFLRFQRTFYKKSFVSGLGADAPTDNTRKKARHCRAFYFTSLYVGTAVMGPCFKGLFEKIPLKIRKTFAPTISLYFCKVFEIPKDFLQKVLWSEFGADAQTFNAYTQKARHCRAFFILKVPRRMLSRKRRFEVL